ncbi:RNA polymerase II subunit A small phosphatase-like protein [Natronocella acetinitrilica]|uniref:RNA polymerase II subunit A small phosphatase-like protein n=1 Tax=Natronocella acetinitrilica TaxID=414046 RepID=A0AAE3G348_9GAMM|nr:HAD family hydrolase [Natronocella acetinitrilica]MCP1674303.1 RNA polymerase II subunit A small phosphatase-like protein [Natronocella acetinitrilica]
MSREPLLVVLDIDETLIHTTSALAQPGIKALSLARLGMGEHSLLRPGLDDFLHHVHRHYPVGYYTAASRDYAEHILDAILPRHARPAFLLTRRNCTLRHRLEGGFFAAGGQSAFHEKNLAKVKRYGFRLERTVMVDDLPIGLRGNYGNLVPIRPFTGESDDDRLPRLARFLDALAAKRNMRFIEKRGWESVDPDDYPEWIIERPASLRALRVRAAQSAADSAPER